MPGPSHRVVLKITHSVRTLTHSEENGSMVGERPSAQLPMEQGARAGPGVSVLVRELHSSMMKEPRDRDRQR